MNFYYVVASFLLIGLSRGSEILEEENVLVLTKDNFDEALKLHPLILVEYYAPWCGHCKKLAPQYAAAATRLKEEGSEIKLAKVDATVEKELGEKAGVRGFPTMKFYRDGDMKDYGGGRDADKIIAWLKKYTGPLAKELSTAEEVEAFWDSANLVVIGLFKDAESNEAKEFFKVAEEIPDATFGVTYTEGTLGDKTAPAVALNLKEEGRVEFVPGPDGYTGLDMDTFVKKNWVPVGAEFGEDIYDKNFGMGINHHMLLFISSKAADHQETTTYFKKLGREFKGKATYMWVDVDKDANQGVLGFFDIEKPKEGETFTPVARIVEFGEDTAKYLPESASTDESSLRAFTQGVIDGKIERHYKSAPLPEDWDALPVKTLVASNFHEVTGPENGKNVFVEFYAPWCGHCKQLAPIWDQLGEKYNGNPNVVIAKMDATANEVKGVSIQGFPTIKYFKADGEVLDYNGKRDLEGFTKFLDSDGVESVPDEEEESEGEEEEMAPEEEGELSEEEAAPEGEQPKEDAKKDEL